MQLSKPRAPWPLALRLLLALLPLALLPLAACAPPAPQPQPQPLPSARPQPQALADARPARAPRPRLSPDELLAQLRSRLSRPAGGLREQLGRDGTRRIALDGHLQHATLAVVGPDGRVHTRCVDNPAAAARVLGVSTSTP